ncbi:spore coat protein CotJB [Beduini massiliensis]|uniref:spore coat protein CotJB n=1 Tax=Beduini massiliensis TaxID=1585974 RepID=UPI000694E67F|nr:spore coat protein CotJB [Beduini massiliensis]
MNYYEDLTQMMMGGQCQNEMPKVCGCDSPMQQAITQMQGPQMNQCMGQMQAQQAPQQAQCMQMQTTQKPQPDKAMCNPAKEKKSVSCIPLGKNYPLFQVDTAFMLGNLYEGLYDPYCGFSNFPLQACNQEQSLLYQVLAFQFAAHELNLLLDNDPKNEKLIQLFNQYDEMYKKLLSQYTKQYRPLFVDNCNPTNHWMWIHSPWPWENK